MADEVGILQRVRVRKLSNLLLILSDGKNNGGLSVSSPENLGSVCHRMEGRRKLQGQDTRGVLKKAPTICGYLGGHSAEIFHLVTSHRVDDLLETGAVRFLFFFGLTFPGVSHLDQNFVICQG